MQWTPCHPSTGQKQKHAIPCLQGLIGGINELTACKALLEPHLTAADAGLAELALSIPLAQVTSNFMHMCSLPTHQPKSRRAFCICSRSFDVELGTLQGLRDRCNLHCWVEAAVQASGERAAPDVLLTIGLQNTGPYPVAQAWSVLIVCRAPALPGGHQTGNTV